jgi:hypothetical protein
MDWLFKWFREFRSGLLCKQDQRMDTFLPVSFDREEWKQRELYSKYCTHVL